MPESSRATATERGILRDGICFVWGWCDVGFSARILRPAAPAALDLTAGSRFVPSTRYATIRVSAATAAIHIRFRTGSLPETPSPDSGRASHRWSAGDSPGPRGATLRIMKRCVNSPESYGRASFQARKWRDKAQTTSFETRLRRLCKFFHKFVESTGKRLQFLQSFCNFHTSLKPRRVDLE